MDTIGSRTAGDSSDSHGERQRSVAAPRRKKSAENDTLWAKDIRNVYIASHKLIEGKDKEGNIIKPFTLYTMFAMTSDGEEVCVFRRYSDFRSLYEILAKAFPREDFNFPKKRFLRSNFEKEFLIARQQALDTFINNVSARKMTVCFVDVVNE